MKRIALVLGLALAGCGDDRRPPQSDGPVTPPDVPPDVPPSSATLTSFVIDLIQNETLTTNAPHPAADFIDLPDPDGANNNIDAYAPLF